MSCRIRRDVLCLFCSLRATTRTTFGSFTRRTLTSSPTLGRPGSNSARARARARWIGKIQSSAAEKASKATRKLPPVNRPLLHVFDGTIEQPGRYAIFEELKALKRLLQKDDLPGHNLATYGDIDPQLKHFQRFEAKVQNCFKPSKFTEEEPEDSAVKLRHQLVNAFLRNGRSGLRRDLLFAYLDHVHEASPKVVSGLNLSTRCNLRHPTEWFPSARVQQRKIHLHVGPTNSGKTYHALKRLEQAQTGSYAGPLRLLAHEVYSRFQSKGIACDLVTGDDVRVDDAGPAALSSHTVEMFDCSRKVEVAVIDEIQMMANERRGWAWTRALLGANASEVHLCGETRVVPLIRELTASMGDTLHIHHYDRLNPLKAMSRSLRGSLKNLRPGDCIVSFSVLGIHAIKKQIEADTGRRVAVIYGGLPPEVRAQQAALFNEPDNGYDFLVASDAIGMGLNLSIKRIIFESLTKFDGSQQIQLSVSTIKQIGGRAGRYRSVNEADASGEDEKALVDRRKSPEPPYKGTAKQSNVGLVSCLDEDDLGPIQMALNAEPEPIRAAGIRPPVEYVSAFANSLPPGAPLTYIMQCMESQAAIHPRYFLCKSDDYETITSLIGSMNGLDITQRSILAAAPVETRTEVGKKLCRSLAQCIATRQAVSILDVREMPLETLDLQPSGSREYLQHLESLHKSLILFIWLSYRFSNIFVDREMAVHTKEIVEEKIETTLLDFSANQMLCKKRLQDRMESDLAISGPSLEKSSPNSVRDGGDASVLSRERFAQRKKAKAMSGTPALAIDWQKNASKKPLPTDSSALLEASASTSSAP